MGHFRGALVLWLVICASASGQTATGSVVARVVDDTDAVLPGVDVELQIDGITAGSAVTDDRGECSFVNLPPGRATLTFKLINFGAARRELTVAAGRTETANVVLRLSLSADVTVTGQRTFRNIADLDHPAENLVGVASAASQGAITAQQLDARPIMRAGEVLETVPGLIVSQHSGEGKANQYYLRGFNLDHGTDFATTIAGTPINMPSHGHFHGYSDTNVLIPELVSGVQFKKGPYFAEDGDFSAAGSANVNYVNQLDGPLVTLTAGDQGFGRVVAAASPQIGGGFLLGAIELNHNNGPWVRPDHYRKVNGLVRFSRGDARNGVSLTGTSYGADWDSTDQIPDRAVDSGLISRFGNIDPTDGGHTYRHAVTVDVQRGRGRGSRRASAYAIAYGLNLFSNFTYFLDDPVNGDQFEQADRRIVSGGRVTYRWLSRLGGHNVETAAGTQVRHDAIGTIGLYKTVRRQRVATRRQDAVDQTSIGVFGQSEIEWAPWIRTTFGLRGDVYRFDVAASDPVNSGRETDGVASPKFGLVFGPFASTEYYVNAGLGFHSNDARGATITRDPLTGEPAARVTPLARARGAEVGLRTVRLCGLQSTLSVWHLGLDSELLFVGDLGTTTASPPTRRYGLEFANYARVKRWLTLDGDVSFSRAHFVGGAGAGGQVPGAVDRVISAGATVEPVRRVFGSVRLRHFGPRALVEDDSVRSKPTTILNSDIGVHLSQRMRISFEAFNLLNAKVSDIDYFYTSRLLGEAAEGVDDIHTHPALPRTARFTLQIAW